jgi:hypothetical protein
MKSTSPVSDDYRSPSKKWQFLLDELPLFVDRNRSKGFDGHVILLSIAILMTDLSLGASKMATASHLPWVQ